MSQQPPNGPDYEGGSQPPVPPPGDPAYGGPSGPYGPGYGGPSGPSGPYGVPPGADPIKPWPVILGVLLGAVVSWVYLAVVLFVGFARSYDASSQGEEAGIWFAGALILAVLPIKAAIVLLCLRRTRHGAKWQRLATRVAHDRGIAEDALQEAFTAAWRHAGGFRGDCSVRAWLATLVRHAVWRQLKRARGGTGELCLGPSRAAFACSANALLSHCRACSTPS